MGENAAETVTDFYIAFMESSYADDLTQRVSRSVDVKFPNSSPMISQILKNVFLFFHTRGTIRICLNESREITFFCLFNNKYSPRQYG